MQYKMMMQMMRQTTMCNANNDAMKNDDATTFHI